MLIKRYGDFLDYKLMVIEMGQSKHGYDGASAVVG